MASTVCETEISDAVDLTTNGTPISGFNWFCSTDLRRFKKITDSSFVRTKDDYIPKRVTKERFHGGDVVFL